MKKLFLFVLLSILVLSGCATTKESESTPMPNVDEDKMEMNEDMNNNIDEMMMELTLEELAMYNGKDSQPAYIAVDGVIYDMSDVPAWSGGMHNGVMAGTDATEAFKNQHNDGRLEEIPVVGKLVTESN